MSKRVVIVLLLAIVCFGLGAWRMARYRERQEINLPILIKLIDEQPRSLIPDSLLLTRWVYGEIEGGVLPLTSAGELGSIDPSRPRLKFFVRTYWRERLDVETKLRSGGIPYLTGSMGLRGYYWGLFLIGSLGLMAAAALLAWERWTRGAAGDQSPEGLTQLSPKGQ